MCNELSKVWSFPSAPPSNKYSSNRSTVRFQFRDFKAGWHAGSWVSCHLRPVGSIPLSRLPRLAAPAGTLPLFRGYLFTPLCRSGTTTISSYSPGFLSLNEVWVELQEFSAEDFTAFSNELPVPLSSGELEEVHLLRMVEV